ALRWTAQRGLFRTEPDPEFLPPKGRDIGVRDALVNVALVLGPDGRLYALGSDDSGATKLRVDVLDTASGPILAARHLGARATARSSRSSPSRMMWIAARWRRSCARIARRSRSWWAGGA